MPLFLLSPLFRYGMAILAVLGLVGAIYGVGRSQGRASERASWEASVAIQKAQASKLISDRIAENAALEASGAALNAKLTEEVANAHLETASALDRYNAAVRVRSRQVSGACSTPPGTPEAPNPGSGQNLDSPGIFVSEQALKDLGSIAADADQLVATMTACRAWSVSVGR